MPRLLLPAAILVALTGGASATTSRTSGRIAYAARGEVRVIGADGSGSRAIANGDAPSWSPNGKVIAFQTARVAANGLDIYLMNADGSSQRQLIARAGDDFDPAWAPNDDTIAFVSTRDGNDELYTVNSIGHAISRVTDTAASERHPAWSADGHRIAFVSDRDGNDEIYSMRADGTDVRRLTDDPEADEAPAWSPDGRQIAFQSSRDRRPQIYVMRADGSDRRRLTNEGAAEVNPAWSPDGSEVAFTSNAGAGEPHVVITTVSGGAARALTAEAADRAAWQPAVDLALALSGTRAVRRGRTAHLQIAIRNVLPFPASNLVLAGSISAGARLMRLQPGCSPSRRFRCSFRALAPPTTIVVDAAVRARRCGRIVLRASVSSVQPDRDAANNHGRMRLRVLC